MINPIPGQITLDEGLEVKINPLEKRRQVGRPKRVIRREPNEPVTSSRPFVIKCSFFMATITMLKPIHLPHQMQNGQD